MSINASALNSLQTRINNERSRRSLSPITFTDGSHATGDTIKAVHFNELRTGTEGLNTLGSQTFNWSGNIAVGASITDVTTQISNFVTTLENEALASWHTINISDYKVTIDNIGDEGTYAIPSQAWGQTGTVRWSIKNHADLLSKLQLSGSYYFVVYRAKYATGTNGFNLGSNGMFLMSRLYTADTMQVNGGGVPSHDWVLPWNDYIRSGSSSDGDVPLQTPFYNNNKGAYNPNQWNHGHGVVVAGASNENYLASDNHYYVNDSTHGIFDANFGYLGIAGWYGSGQYPKNLASLGSAILVEAYY